MSEIIPVLFRKSEGDVVAVFPTLPADDNLMTCYAHIGQHSACSMEWYHTTKQAKPFEYAELLAELERIGYQMRVVKRLSYEMRSQRRAAVHIRMVNS